MDPISLTGLAFSVAQVCGLVTDGLSSTINAIKEVPGELIAAKNEVADFQAVLWSVQKCIEQEDAAGGAQAGASAVGSSSGSATAVAQTPTAASVVTSAPAFMAASTISTASASSLSPVLGLVPASVPVSAPTSASSSTPAPALPSTQVATTLMNRARTNLHGIEEVIRAYGCTNGANSGNVPTDVPWVKRIRPARRSRLKRLLDELKSIRQSIGTEFSVQGSAHAFRSASATAQLGAVVSTIKVDSVQHSRKLDDVLQKLTLLEGTSPSSTANSTPVTTPDQTLGATTQGNLTTRNPTPVIVSARQAPEDEFATEPQQATTSVVKLDISRFLKQKCNSFCSCACHRRHRKKFPTLTNKVLGSLFLGYSSLPFTGPSCDDEACKQRSTFSATLTYYFPSWFLRQSLSLVLMTTHLGDLGSVIKFRQVQYFDFSMFRSTERGDWRGVKGLLDARRAHPSASWFGGWTALHYAISYGHAKVCRLLLSRDADPLIEDGDDQVSPLELAWTKILTKAFPAPTLQALQDIFTDRECLEEFSFSAIHKAVLALHPISLDSVLATYPNLIDVPDAEGRTPLFWAAARADLPALTALLAAGADPNLRTRTDTSPLMTAAQAQDPCCIAPLLAAGAEVDDRDKRLHTALFGACISHDDPRFVEPLLDAGADINAKTDYDQNPLISATSRDHARVVELLISRGADLNVVGQSGGTPLAFAVEYNSHACLALLLNAGADPSRFNGKRGPTLAHTAARHADVETCRILAAGVLAHRNSGTGLTGFGVVGAEDLAGEDHEGRDVQEIINKRAADGGLDPAFEDAFQAVLDALGGAGMAMETGTGTLGSGSGNGNGNGNAAAVTHTDPDLDSDSDYEELELELGQAWHDAAELPAGMQCTN